MFAKLCIFVLQIVVDNLTKLPKLKGYKNSVFKRAKLKLKLKVLVDPKRSTKIIDSSKAHTVSSSKTRRKSFKAAAKRVMNLQTPTVSEVFL